MDEYVKESIMEMCSIVGENNTNDFLMVDKILFIESEEIQLKHFENNLSEDNEVDDKEEVFHISIKKSY